MGATPKIFETGARQLEKGKNGGSQSDGWGAANSARDLNAAKAFPYLTMEVDEEYDFKDDESITSSAFQSAERLMGITTSKPISFLDRFYGQDDLNYWTWGFENVVKSVVALKGAFSGTPSKGDIYTEGGHSYTYLRTETGRVPVGNTTVKIYIFQNDGTNVPASQTGQMLEGANEFNFTSHSGQMYEHFYELDKYNRNLRVFTAAEQSALAVDGWETDDLRNIMMTIGKKFDTYDVKVQNLICKSFNWKLTAGDEARIEAEFVAYKKSEGSFNSSTWVLQDGGDTQDNSPASFETQVYIGTELYDENLAGGNMLDIDFSEFNLNVNIPVEEEQSFVSGYFLQQPIMNAHYDLSWDGIIARHDTLDYQDKLRNGTKVITHVISIQDWYMKEFMIKKSTLKKAGADNSDVAKEPLEGSVDYVKSVDNTFTDRLQGVSELHNSPILMRVRNFDSENQMFEN
ncbi:MAG: hypothetical protein ACTSXT_13775 [Candidatus Helarchaeota archaeon]